MTTLPETKVEQFSPWVTPTIFLAGLIGGSVCLHVDFGLATFTWICCKQPVKSTTLTLLAKIPRSAKCTQPSAPQAPLPVRPSPVCARDTVAPPAPPAGSPHCGPPGWPATPGRWTRPTSAPKEKVPRRVEQSNASETGVHGSRVACPLGSTGAKGVRPGGGGRGEPQLWVLRL